MPESQALISSPPVATSRAPSKDRLKQAVAAFEQSLKETKKASLSVRFSNLRTRSRPFDLTDVTRLAEEISDDCAVKHGSGWRHYAMRIIPILDRIRQFAPIGDVVTGGAQNMVVSGVWGAVRLALEISLSVLAFFEKVSELLLRVGRFSRLHQDFTILFPDSDELQTLAWEYLAIVVDISTKVVRYSQHSTGRQIFHSFVATFDSEFGPLEETLKALDLRIERITNVLAVQRNQKNHRETHQLTKKVLSKLSGAALTRSRQARETKRHRMLTALCSSPGDFELIYRRQRRKGHSSWLFSEPVYKSWASSPTSSSLWLRGKLGSGKSTVLASAVANLIVERLEPEKPEYVPGDPYLGPDLVKPLAVVTVSSFFCTSANRLTLKPAAIFGSITYQILSSASMATHLLTYLDKKTIENIHQEPTACVDLLLRVTPTHWNGYIVLDGLDEFNNKDLSVVIEELERLAKRRTIHFLGSSRSGWEHFEKAKDIIPLSSVIDMEDFDRSPEVDSYISAYMTKWKTMREITPELESLIIKQLQLGWGGMFLWLALQVASITADLGSDIAVIDIITKLPKDLPNAFDRVLVKISDHQFGSTVMKTVAAAEEPMTVSELYVVANVVPGSLDWDPVPAQLSSFLWRYGGNVLEVDEEDQKVRFIHHSILLHLLGPLAVPEARPFHFDLGPAKHHFGSALVTYLNFPQFDRQMTTSKQQQPEHRANVPTVVAQSVLPRNAHVQTALRLLLSRPNQQKRSSNIDIDALLIDLIRTKSEASQLEVEALLEYAKINWLLATRRFRSWHITGVEDKWNRLFRVDTLVADLPFRSLSVGKMTKNGPVDDAMALSSNEKGALWAMTSGHYPVFTKYGPGPSKSPTKFDRTGYALDTLSRSGLGIYPMIERMLQGEFDGREPFVSDWIGLRGSILNHVFNWFLDASFDMAQESVLGCVLLSLIFYPHEAYDQWSAEDKDAEDKILRSMAPKAMAWMLGDGFPPSQCVDDPAHFVNYLVKHLARHMDINEPIQNPRQKGYGLTPLQYVIEERGFRYKYIRPLLSAGALLTSPIPAILDPFLMACLAGNSLAVRVLIAAGVDLNTVVQGSYLPQLSGQNGLMLCLGAYPSLRGGSRLLEETALELIGGGIDLELRDSNGQTALHIAADRNFETGVRLILKAAHTSFSGDGGKRRMFKWLNCANRQGRTALHQACNRGASHCILYLLNQGAQTHLHDENGNKARDLFDQALNSKIISPSQSTDRLLYLLKLENAAVSLPSIR